jgi:hypothetical protein
MSDTVTILHSLDRRQAKTIIVNSDGQLETKADADAYLFRGSEHPVGNIFDLARVFDEASKNPFNSVVRGAIAPGIDRSRMLRRKYPRGEEQATLIETPRHYLPIDLDDLPLPEGFDQFANPVETVKLALSFLPAVFRDVTCWFQFTSGAGVKADLRMRLAFWLDRPLGDQELKWWLPKRKFQGVIDHSAFNTVQPIFVARPTIGEGAWDPVPCARSGILRGASALVAVPEIKMPDPSTEDYSSSDHNPSASFAEALERIGDHDGGDGCYPAMTHAVGKYFSEHREKGDRPALFAMLAARVKAATWNPKEHSAAYVASKLDAVKGLIERIYQYEVEAAKERANASGFSPIDGDDSDAVSLDEAQDRIEAAISGLILFPPCRADHALPEQSAICISPGGGKTHEAALGMVARGMIGHESGFVYAIPTHAKADEVAALVNKHARYEAAHVWRGAEYPPKTPDQDRMCPRYRVVKDVVKAGGTIGDVCGSKTRGFCPHHPVIGGECRYRRQLDRRPAIWVVPSSLLGSMPPAAMSHTDCLIIDERLELDVVDTTISDQEIFGPRTVRLGLLLSSLRDTIQKLNPGDYLSRGVLVNPSLFTDEAIETARKLEWAAKKEPKGIVNPATGEVEPAALAEVAKHNNLIGRRAAVWRELGAFLATEEQVSARIRRTAGGLIVESPARVHPDWLEKRAVVMMDATLDLSIAQTFLPRLKLVASISIEPGALVQVRQAVEPVGYKRIVPGVTAPEGSWQRAAQENAVADVMRAVEVLAYRERRQGGTVGLIGPLRTMEHAEAAWDDWGTWPVGLKAPGHFQGLRGLNDLEQVALLVVLSRPLPKPAEVEALARVAFNRQVSTVNGPYYPSRLVRLDNGAGEAVATVKIPYHPDAGCNAVLRQLCDAEVQQAVHRARPVRRNVENAPRVERTLKISTRGQKPLTWTVETPVPLRIDILTNVPTGLPISEIVTFNDWLSVATPPAVVLARGFWPDGRGAWAARAAILRDWFNSEEAARKAWERADRSTGHSSIEESGPPYIEDCPFETSPSLPPSWPVYRYRAAGARYAGTVAVDPDLHADPCAAWEARLGLKLDFFVPAAGRKK